MSRKRLKAQFSRRLSLAGEMRCPWRCLEGRTCVDPRPAHPGGNWQATEFSCSQHQLLPGGSTPASLNECGSGLPLQGAWGLGQEGRGKSGLCATWKSPHRRWGL